MNERFPAVSWLLALTASLVLGGCAALSGPRDVELPLAKLQQSLASKLPANARYLDLFDISVTNPRLQLEPESNRVTTVFDASIAPVFTRTRWHGSLTLSGVLAIDPQRHAVVLREPRMDELLVDGLDVDLTARLAKVGGVLAQKILGDVPLYTFDPAQFQYAGVRFFPTRISTQPQAIVVTFEPVK